MPKGNDTHEEKKSGPLPVDIHVGSQLRARRLELGMTQGDLANILGLTFQQVQKYERGTNRMGASRLYEMAKAINVDVSYFYEGIDPITGEIGLTSTQGLVREIQQQGLSGENAPNEKEILAIIGAISSLTPDQREHMLKLMKTMGPKSPDTPRNKK